MKKVSVIMPVYNMENCVREGVACVTGQTYKNLEIIIIDDGSTDKTYFKCLAEADRDRRIAVFSKNNEGPAVARNLALRKATGDYVYFFDMDDYIKPNTIERLVTVLEESGCDLAACGFEMFDGKKVTRTVVKEGGYRRTGSEARADYGEQLLMFEPRGIQGAPWYKLYKMSIIREHGIEFPSIRYGEDDVFIARYISHADSFILTGDVLCRYYINTCRRFWDKYRFDMFDTVREHTMYMLDIVYAWNGDNTEVRDIIYRDYFQKTFSSLCVLFNPHMKIKKKARMARIKEIADTFASDVPSDFKSPHIVADLMRAQEYNKIYFRILLHIIKHRFD